MKQDHPVEIVEVSTNATRPVAPPIEIPWFAATIDVEAVMLSVTVLPATPGNSTNPWPAEDSVAPLARTESRVAEPAMYTPYVEVAVIFAAEVMVMPTMEAVLIRTIPSPPIIVAAETVIAVLLHAPVT